MTTTTQAPSATALAEVREWCQTGAAAVIIEASRLSPAEVAAHIGVSPSTVSRWIACENQPKGEPAVRFRDVLNELCNPASPLRRDPATAELRP